MSRRRADGFGPVAERLAYPGGADRLARDVARAAARVFREQRERRLAEAAPPGPFAALARRMRERCAALAQAQRAGAACQPSSLELASWAAQLEDLLAAHSEG